MPRYLIERAWGALEEEEMAAKGPLSKRLLSEGEQFSGVTWEHSHVVIGEDGLLRSFCVYSSPNTELIQEHSTLLGDHMIEPKYHQGICVC